MILKTPSFWYRPQGSAAPRIEKILWPFSWLYRLGYECDQRLKKRTAFDIPVLCIGNLNAGGAGKTPVAIAVMRAIKQQGLAKNPWFLTRGHGGAERGPLQVDPERHSAWDVGDEPLILAKDAATVVAADRKAGVAFALKYAADLIIMDDGLQNPSVAKSVKCVVINGEMGFGNGRLLPAGPLREPLDQGLKRADFFVMLGRDTRETEKLLPLDTPLIRASMKTDRVYSPYKNYIAFAGLGYPEKFFSFLKNDLQMSVVETIKFADHYPYNSDDILQLKKLAAEKNAALITTEKDYMRLPDKMPGLLEIVQPHIEWDDPAGFHRLLKSLVEREA